jgi:hypothetical protein
MTGRHQQSRTTTYDLDLTPPLAKRVKLPQNFSAINFQKQKNLSESLPRFEPSTSQILERYNYATPVSNFVGGGYMKNLGMSAVS